MILWRLTPAQRTGSALDGNGAAIAGGRWNSKGVHAVYLSLDPATTILETLTTFSRSTAPAGGYRLLKLEYDGSTEQLGIADLPSGWDRPDDASVARTIGDKFLLGGSACVLLVPSVVLKSATNAVLNPLHPDAARARIIGTEEYSFDPRWPLK